MGSMQSTDADLKLGQQHEIQVTEEKGVDLQKYLEECAKNPGHSDMIPVKAFSLVHIPEPHRDIRLLNCLQTAADLTVRVEAREVSSYRPEFWPNTRESYPLHTLKERAIPRFGSGKIVSVQEFSKESNFGSHFSECQCRKCRASASASNVWGEVQVLTAAHLVYDDNEAESATCRLFYDVDDDSPLVEIDGVEATVDTRNDRCLLNCVSCDLQVVSKLKELLTTFDRVCDILYKKYDKNTQEAMMVFMVSHPHGGPKRVSIGKLINRHVYNLFSSLNYLMPTCPGCSGAPLYILGHKTGYSSKNQHIHMGTAESGAGYSNKVFDTETLREKVTVFKEMHREYCFRRRNSTSKRQVTDLELD